jgi:hypothetical protein
MKLSTVQVAEMLKISRMQALNLFKHGLLANVGEPSPKSTGKRGIYKVEASVLREFARSEQWRQRKPGKTLFNKNGEFRTFASNGGKPAPAVVTPTVTTAPSAGGAPMGGLRDQLDRIEQKIDRLLRELGVGQ